MGISDNWLYYQCETSLQCVLRVCDLRFDSTSNEAAYRHELQNRSFLPASLLGFGHVTLQLCWHAFRYATEGLDIGDTGSQPHAIAYLCLQILAVMAMCMASAGSLLKTRVRYFRACAWEPVWACALSVNMVASWFQGSAALLLFGVRPDDAERPLSPELSVDLAPLAFVVGAGSFLPMRCCYLGPLSAFALLLALAQLTLSTSRHAALASSLLQRGSLISQNVLQVCMVLLIISGSYASCCKAEREHRSQWVRSSMEHVVQEAAVQKVQARATLTRDLKVFRQAGCHVVLSLHEDLRVCGGSGRAAASFFGGDVLGTDFLDLIDSVAKTNFLRACERVKGSRIPKSMPLAMLVSQQKPELCLCRVLVVYHGRPGRQYLVGIKVGDFKKMDDKTASHEHNFGMDSAIVPTPSVIGKARSRAPVADAKYGATRRGQIRPEDRCNAVVPKLTTARRKVDTSDFSGLSSDPEDPGSDASLRFSSSSEDCTACFSTIFAGRDMATQTDPMLGKVDACVETSVVWRGDFKCRCCSRPPAPLDDYQRISSQIRYRKRRKKPVQQESATLDALSGSWVIHSQFISIAQAFMHRLTFVGDRCIDAAGQRWKVHKQGNELYLIKGRIWISGAVLYREGKSGVVMKFQRAEEPADIFDPSNFDDEYSTTSSKASPSIVDGEQMEQDDLAKLESLVAQGAAGMQLGNFDLLDDD
eukprot:TRINITY_DN14449_c0_g1_i6.p1 TRINITY_DN14449_c0_g1~~TRINITY_DN14449_c0_g1_i6.p1  ORF type:complete len:703 (+),score=100.78 TRINITY_DN14449_c0_g1_i6:98-2206(+)